MANSYLTETETGILQGFLVNGQIIKKMLPVEMSIGMDSMGPMRDSRTDQLFPGIAEALGRFSAILDKYQLMFVVATNGPDVEGEDILNVLEGPVAALAVTEGGGKLIARQPQTGELEYEILADKEELTRLGDLEAVVRERPLMRALLGDREPTDGNPPIRTPYDTNIVITLPTTFEVFNARLSTVKVDLQKELSGVGSADYVNRVLSYVDDAYADGIQRLGMDRQAKVLTKAQNRRTYVMPRHDFHGDQLSKYSGAVTGSHYMFFAPGYPERVYELLDSWYVADKAVDVTGEGQRVIGASERSMVIGSAEMTRDGQIFRVSKVIREGGQSGLDYIPKHTDVNIVDTIPFGKPPFKFFADVACRLAVNVTMDDKPPRMDRVENVTVMHIGSGLKALEAITYFYQRLHG